MKSFGILLCSMFLSALLFVSCNKGISVKGEDGKEYTTYQAACRDNDYNAAHEFLDALKEKADEPAKSNIFTGSDWDEKKSREKSYQDALDYVFTQEMMYLVGEGSDAAINRILFLITETRSQLSQAENANEKKRTEAFLKKQCDQVVDLALSQGKIDLVKKVIPLYKDSETQVKKCLQLIPKDEEFVDMTFDLLSSYNFKGSPVTEGLQDYYYISEHSISGEDENYQRYLYINDLGTFNNLCNQFLDYSINKGNKELAQKLLQLYKQNVVVAEHRGEKINGIELDGNHSYVSFNYQDKQAAQKRYKEAVANGKFKK